MDLAFTHAGSPGLSLWRNIEGKRLESVPLPKLNWTDGWGLAAVDYDNDGWVDLAAVGIGGLDGAVHPAAQRRERRIPGSLAGDRPC